VYTNVAVVGFELKITPDIVDAQVAIAAVDVEVRLARHMDLDADALEAKAETHFVSAMESYLHSVPGLRASDFQIVVDLPPTSDYSYTDLLARGNSDLDITIVRVHHDFRFPGDRIIVFPLVSASERRRHNEQKS
jgi:hypothetical protein